MTPYVYDQRVASSDSLYAAKSEWAQKLVGALEQHFKGWHVFHGLTIQPIGGSQPGIHLRYGNPGHEVFLAVATVSVAGNPMIHASIEVNKKGLAALEDDGAVEVSLLDDVRYDRHEADLPVNEQMALRAVALAVSKWFSGHLDGMVR